MAEAVMNKPDKEKRAFLLIKFIKVKATLESRLFNLLTNNNNFAFTSETRARLVPHWTYKDY
jgi:hypothetical protein